MELLVKENNMDPLENVGLSLEESGWLCHLLMAEIGPYVTGRKAPRDKMEASILERKITLYEKLSLVNDKLMGKV